MTPQIIPDGMVLATLTVNEIELIVDCICFFAFVGALMLPALFADLCLGKWKDK